MKKLLASVFLLFSTLFVYGQSWLWVDGSSTVEYGAINSVAIATDLSGNVFETGRYIDTASFGKYRITSTDPHGDIFLVKYDPTGNILWLSNSKSDSNYYNFPYSLATDAAGNSYITGQFGDTIVFGNVRLFSKECNMFLVKYKPNGSVAWGISPKISSAGYVQVRGVSVDLLNNIYVAGYFGDTLIIGQDSLLDGSANGGIFIAKYDPLGKPIWAKEGIAKGGTNSYGNLSLNCDVYGNVYLYGPYNDTIKFGANIMSTPPYYGIDKALYLIKFDSSGGIRKISGVTLLSSNSFTDNYGGWDNRHPLASDNLGNIYISCEYYGSIQIGAKVLSSPKVLNNFFAKLDTSGSVIWAQSSSIPSLTSWANVNSISPDKYGHVYLSGTFQDTLTIGGITLTSDSTPPSFLIKFDSSGNGICSTYINTNGIPYGPSYNVIVADPEGDNVYITGDVLGYPYCVFGGDTLKGGYQTKTWSFAGKWSCVSPLSINYYGINNNCISVYPNPSNGKFTITIDDGQLTMDNEKPQITIYNILGEDVPLQLSIVHSQLSIDISNQPAGIYLFRLVSHKGEYIASGKLVIE